MFHLYPFANNNNKEKQQDSHLIEVKTGHKWLIQRKNIIYGNTHFFIKRIQNSNLSSRMKRVLSYLGFAIIFLIIVIIFNHHSANYLAINS